MMNKTQRRLWNLTSLRALLAAVLCAAPLVPFAAQAATLRLRAECQCEGAIVTLGDVAEIEANDAERAELAAIELFPAPAAGIRRYVRAREILDALALRGIDLKSHRLTGSSQVHLARSVEEDTKISAPAPAPVRPVSRYQARDVSERVRRAIVKHLEAEATEDEAWEVQLKLTDEQVRQLATLRGEWFVEGGESPWTGPQQFFLTDDRAEQTARIPVETEVTTPPAVVAVIRALPAGALLHEADLELVPGKPGSWTEPYLAIDRVVGQETRRPVVAGQILDRNDVRAPILVRRGDAVTVYARSAGVQVRTTARAQDEGARGDLISVESLSDRQRFFVRVSGIQECEVFAHGARAASEERPAADARPQTTRRRGEASRSGSRTTSINQQERR